MRMHLPKAPLAMLLVQAAFATQAAYAADDEIVCENLQTPVEVARNVFVIETETRCFHPRRPERDALERVKIACDVLIAAYGAEDGGARCREIVERTGVLPAP